jgi:small acid-soluble spore protein (thioredoxin-like protein)
VKHNPDDRRDNVERIQRNINATVENIRLANETLEETDNDKTKREIIEKNNRRQEALEGMRKEIKDEAAHRDRMK